jgi:hypothetical protein
MLPLWPSPVQAAALPVAADEHGHAMPQVAAFDPFLPLWECEGALAIVEPPSEPC